MRICRREREKKMIKYFATKFKCIQRKNNIQLLNVRIRFLFEKKIK